MILRGVEPLRFGQNRMALREAGIGNWKLRGNFQEAERRPRPKYWKMSRLPRLPSPSARFPELLPFRRELVSPFKLKGMI